MFDKNLMNYIRQILRKLSNFINILELILTILFQKNFFFFDNISKELWRNMFSSISFDKPHLICIMHTTLSSNNVIGLSFIKRSLHDSWIY